jgi:hypothetical protein
MKRIIFTTLASLVTGLLVGGFGGYSLASNDYNKAIAEQALIDISRQLSLMQKLQTSSALPSVKAEIDLNIHRHLSQVMRNDALIRDQESLTYKTSVMSRLAAYWKQSPPFEEAITAARTAKNAEMERSLLSARDYANQFAD